MYSKLNHIIDSLLFNWKKGLLKAGQKEELLT